jgi:hypothetical protein
MVSGGLTINPMHPYVIVQANPDGTLHELNGANDTASFRVYTVGVITHGGIQPSSWKAAGPPWERMMAANLKQQGYDEVIAYNWVADSGHAGAAAKQAPRLVNDVVQAAAQLPQGAPVDVHFIGHSEGTVVNSMAVEQLDQEGWPAGMKAGYLKVTMLDPHAASNGVAGPQFSVSHGLLGWVARGEITRYQSQAKDPVPVFTANVDSAEVFYQHTPVGMTHGSNNGIYNLWGQVPVKSAVPVAYFNLTAPGISHAGRFGVMDWYRLNVVPTLGDGGSLVTTSTLTAQAVAPADQAHPYRPQVAYAGHAAPGSLVRLIASQPGESTMTVIGRARALADGSYEVTSVPLHPGPYHMLAFVTPRVGPTGHRSAMKPVAWIGRVDVARPGA